MTTAENRKSELFKVYRFPILLIISIIVGCIVGVVMGPKASMFKPFGDIFLNLLFTTVVPLVFFTISSAVGNMISMRRLGKILSNLLLVFVVTGMIASAVIIVAVKVFPPAQGVQMDLPAMTQEVQQINFMEQVVKILTVDDFVGLMSKANMMPLIVFSVLFGFCVSLTAETGNEIGKLLDMLSNVLMKAVNIIMWYAPIGLAAYFANLVGQFGSTLIGAYLRALALFYPICVMYFFVFFALYAHYAAGKEGVKSFFKHIFPAAVTSLATMSSLATMPVNLNAAEKIGIPKDISKIVLPIGATMHMDGGCLSCILKIAFLFGIFGRDFSGIGTYASAILISVVGGVVMSGVPGGGIIGEMLIVNVYGFPAEALPIIITMGFLVDAICTVLNACGDTVASMMIARRVEGKDWFKRAHEKINVEVVDRAAETMSDQAMT